MSTEELEYIGIFNDSFPPIIDGVTQTILNYADWFNAHGENPCIVTPYNPLEVETPYKILRYFSLPIRSRKPYRYGYPKLDFKIWKSLRETPFRIIHSHSPFAAGRLGVYAKKYQNVPLIGTFHSKYKSDLKHSFKLMPFCVPIIMKRILDFYNACDEVWIPQASVEETIRSYGFKGKVEVVENGIDYADLGIADLKQFKKEARKKLGIDERSLSLLFVGQHIWEKGIGIIFDTLRLLKDKIDFQMTFIGDGYAKRDLIEMIKKEGLGERVTTLDIITDREELKHRYAAADLFLFPSRYDNAPLVIREAACLGTPAIIPDDSTASEVIIDGSNGYLTADSAESYASLIMKLSEKKDSLIGVGENARKSIVRGWDDIMEEVSDRYSKLIARKNGEKIIV